MYDINRSSNFKVLKNGHRPETEDVSISNVSIYFHKM